MKNRTFRSVLFRRLALVVFLAASIITFRLVDALYGEVSIVPLLATILLFGLSLVIRPAGLLFAILVLIPFVIFSLLAATSFDPGKTESLVRFGVRLMAFVTAGVIATLASHFRTRALDMLRQTKILLDVMPLPIILSDSAGRVVWCNRACRQLGSITITLGRPLLELLPIQGPPVDYTGIFESETNLPEAALQGFRTSFVRLHSARQRLLATILWPSDR